MTEAASGATGAAEQTPLPYAATSYIFPDGRSPPGEQPLQSAYVFNGPPRPDWFDVWILQPELAPLHLTWMFTLVLAVFAIAAWRDSKSTTDALANQAHSAQGQLELLQAEQRPWVSVAVSPDKLTVDLFRPAQITALDQLDTVVSIKLPVINSGKIPARFVELEGNVVFRASSMTREADRQRGSLNIESEACKSAASKKHSPKGATVFPSLSTTLSSDLHMYPDEIKRWMKEAGRADEDLIVTGCIDYVIGERLADHHQTKFAYTILHSNGTRVDPNIPADNVLVSRIAFSGLKLDTINDAMLDAN